MDNWGPILLVIVLVCLSFYGLGTDQRRFVIFFGVCVFLMWLFGFWEN